MSGLFYGIIIKKAIGFSVSDLNSTDLTEEGLGTSYLARKAAKQLIQKTGVDPDTIDALIVTTTTPDYKFPSTASIVLGKLGLKNAFAFDFSAACC